MSTDALAVEGIPVDVTTPPEPVMKTMKLLDFWLFLIGRAAILKGIAEQTRFRGYVPRGQGLRAQARARGFSNMPAMARAEAAKRAAVEAEMAAATAAEATRIAA